VARSILSAAGRAPESYEGWGQFISMHLGECGPGARARQADAVGMANRPQCQLSRGTPSAKVLVVYRPRHDRSLPHRGLNKFHCFALGRLQLMHRDEATQPIGSLCQLGGQVSAGRRPCRTLEEIAEWLARSSSN
jgi:hypothetical protein